MNWIHGSDLPTVANIFAREFDVDAAGAAWWPLLETFLTSISHGIDVDGTLRTLCPLWAKLKKAHKKHKSASFFSGEQRKALKNLKRSKTCPGCGSLTESHEILKEALR
jgi:hypothetical protein